MKLFSYILIISLLFSCYTTNKAKKQVSKAHALKPNVTAELCTSFYPTKDSIIESIKIINGKNDTLTYTVNDTVVKNDTVYIYLDRTKYINRTDTIKSTFVQYKESTSKLIHYQNQITDLNQHKTEVLTELKIVKKSRKNWMFLFFTFIGIYLGKVWITKRI